VEWKSSMLANLMKLEFEIDELCVIMVTVIVLAVVVALGVNCQHMNEPEKQEQTK
jgi:hypothetical protein